MNLHNLFTSIHFFLQQIEKETKSDEPDQQNEQISTSVTSPDEPSPENLVDSSPLTSDLQEMSTEKTDVTEPAASSFNDSETFSEALRIQVCSALQIQVCSESDKSEPQTTSPSTLTDDADVSNEIVSSAEEVPVETMEQPFTVTTATSDSENLADSSTSQEEVADSQGESPKSENVEKITESEDTNLTDEVDADSKEPVNEDVPMEVDIVAETECKEKAVADEPSSTSNDSNL